MGNELTVTAESSSGTVLLSVHLPARYVLKEQSFYLIYMFFGLLICRWSSEEDSSQRRDLGFHGSAAGPSRVAAEGRLWRWCCDTNTSSQTSFLWSQWSL